MNLASVIWPSNKTLHNTYYAAILALKSHLKHRSGNRLQPCLVGIRSAEDEQLPNFPLSANGLCGCLLRPFFEEGESGNMERHHSDVKPAVSPVILDGVNTSNKDPIQPAMTEERMPFTVKIVQSDHELGKAVNIRHAAYARHVPDVAARLRESEPYDREEGTIVLLAESKLDGSPLGTMRIQTNRFKALAVEQSVTLPDWLQGATLAEATRLGISEGRIGRVVKTMLFKAYFLYCQSAGIEWMVITARSPLDRQYDALLFKDVFADGGFRPMKHVGNIPHRVLAFEVGTAEPRWAAANHPLFNFIFRTCHPDLDLDEGTTARSADPIQIEIRHAEEMCSSPM
jgi:hypothetical protein